MTTGETPGERRGADRPQGSGKMPSLRRGGLPGSFNLPRELRMSVLCHLALGKIRVPFKTDTDYPVTLDCSVNRCFFNAAGTDKLTP